MSIELAPIESCPRFDPKSEVFPTACPERTTANTSKPLSLLNSVSFHSFVASSTILSLPLSPSAGTSVSFTPQFPLSLGAWSRWTAASVAVTVSSRQRWASALAPSRTSIESRLSRSGSTSCVFAPCVDASHVPKVALRCKDTFLADSLVVFFKVHVEL